MTPVLCIYHGNCADGFAAAWAVRARLDDAEFHAGIYGQPPPDVTGRRVVLVDYSYKRDVIAAMSQSAASILIVDHHKSAAEDLAGLPTPPPPPDDRPDLTGWLPDSGVWARFDMDHSGAMLAWQHFHGTAEPPELLRHIEDRDLWRFALPGTREIQAAVFSYPYDFEVWSRLMWSRSIDSLRAEGVAIERKHHKDVAELVAVTRRDMTIGDVVVPVASLPYTLVSDAAHLMAADAPFAGCYWDTPTGRVFGLRSRPDGADVSEVAKRYGGGGHKHAAGFTVPRDHPLAAA